MCKGLNYDAVGTTQPASRRWVASPTGYRRHEHTVRIGEGQAHWEYVSAEILRWGIKTRSGFSVAPDDTAHAARVREGSDYNLTAHLGPLTIHEPVRVIAVVERADWCGFSYGTLHGHPVSGEEAFIAHRASGGSVWLTLRSLTRPARGVWTIAFPGLLIAQRHYRRRYTRALAQRPE